LHITDIRADSQIDALHLCEKCAQDYFSHACHKTGVNKAGVSANKATGDFTLDDLRKQINMIAKMGGMPELLAQLENTENMISGAKRPEQAIQRMQGIIDSMTTWERRNPDIIDLSRRRRIAAGSGAQPHEVGEFITQFYQVRTLTRQMKFITGFQGDVGPAA
jgi:signal recognition particle subunit SRP54